MVTNSYFLLDVVKLDVDVDVLVLSETWFSSVAFHAIEGYNDYHAYRQDRTGGGISIYVKNKYKSSLIPHMTFVTPTAEFSVVNVALPSSENVNIVGFYRPPSNTDIEGFCNLFRDRILSQFSPSQWLLTGGDANIDLSTDNRMTNYYINMLHSYSLLPYITIPTRVTSSSSTVIDHMWSNILSDVMSGVIETDITDHFTVFMCISGKKSEGNLVRRQFRDCSVRNIEKLQRDLSLKLNNFHMYNNINVTLRTKIFCEIFQSSYNMACPVRTKYISRSTLSKPWFDEDLKKLCNIKHRMFKQYKNGLIDFSVYNEFKNKFTSIVRRTKKNYYNDLFDKCKSDIKSTWKNINKVLGNKRKVAVNKLIKDDVSIEDSSDISKMFNKYFTSVAGELRRQIPDSNLNYIDYMGSRSLVEMDFVCTDCAEVESVISNLANKSSRINTLPVLIYKSVKNIISPYIADLFNSSVLEGLCPQNIKIAEVIPIHKAGASTEVANYRPISLLPILSKIFERLLRSRLLEYFNENNVLCKHQFGFRSGHDTSDAILEFLNHCYSSLDCRKHLLAIYIDLSRAFDTLDHCFLLGKLDHIGVRGSVLEWVRSYLTGRQQFVTVGDSSSPLEPLTMGVPQGSVLGPLLFLLYINDMSCSSNLLNFVHFADDTTVFLSGRDVSHLSDTVNVEFSKVDSWLVVNKLSLNLSKTTYMIITHSSIPDDLSIRIRDVEINRVSVSKFLGIHIDDGLTFKYHIDKLTNKLSKSLGIMYKLSHFVPSPILLSLYFALVHSGLIYGLTSWGSSADLYIRRVKSIQNRAIKLIDNNVNGFYVNKILKFDDLYKYFCSVKFYKCTLLGNHEYFSLSFKNLLPAHNYLTRHRNADRYNIPIFNKTRGQRSFFYNSTKIWNSIPLHIKSCNSLQNFKLHYKTFLISNYAIS